MFRTGLRHHGCTIINEMKILIAVLLMSIKVFAFQQSTDSTYYVTFPTCDIVSDKIFKTTKERRDWNMLKANVKKVYPYSIYVKMKLAEMDAQLAFYKTQKEKDTFILWKICRLTWWCWAAAARDMPRPGPWRAKAPRLL